MRPFALAWIVVTACSTAPYDDGEDDADPEVVAETDRQDSDVDPAHTNVPETDVQDTEVDDTDASVPEPDADHDGSPDVSDCDDTDASIHPGAVEDCDEVDRDCDGDPVLDAADAQVWYADLDGDGFGGGIGVPSCVPLSDHTNVVGDCDDRFAAVHPGAPEICDGRDNDCVGPWSATAEVGLVTFTDPAGGVSDVTGQFSGELALSSGAYRICEGRWDVSLTADHVDVELLGFGNAVLDGKDAHRLVDVHGGTMLLTGLTLDEGFVVDDGGLLRAEDADITLRGGALTDGVAVGSGGAIAVRGGTLTASALTVRHNEAGASGGAISAVDAVVSLTSSAVSLCQAGRDGGGVALVGGDMTVKRTTFFSNHAMGGDGGAIRVERPADQLWIGFSMFDANTAVHGGGIAAVDANLLVQTGQFVDGRADECGGAVHAVGSDLSVVDSELTGNVAASGGGVCVRDAHQTLLAGGPWSDNSADGGGQDDGFGGAILAEGAGKLTLDTLTLLDNRARWGGAAALRASTPAPHAAELVLFYARDNQADEDGGALYLENVGATLSGSIDLNDAGGRGGGVWIAGDPADTEVMLTLNGGSRVGHNGAQAGGGAWVGPGAAVVCGDNGATLTPAIIGNVTRQSGSGAVALTSSDARFEARQCDLGVAGTVEDNVQAVGGASADVWAGALIALEDGATASCDGSGCAP